MSILRLAGKALVRSGRVSSHVRRRNQRPWRIMHRRTLLLLPLGQPAWAAEPSVPAGPFVGLEQRIAAEHSDVQSVVVVRENRLLFEYYKAGADSDALRPVESVTKSVLSTLVGTAIGGGSLASLDQSVPDLIARIAPLSDEVRELKLTFRHLLSMTAGFAPTGRVTRRQSDDPLFLLQRARAAEAGALFHYDNHASNLLASALELAIGQPLLKFARASLFEPLGVSAVEWEMGPNRHAYGASGLWLRTRDMVRLGQLMLERGSWQGSQLIPAPFVNAAVSPVTAGGPPVGLPYGYGWWTTSSS